MSGFWGDFVANLAADALLAIAIYLIVTQPGEKKKSEQRKRQALGILKSEAMVNQERATSCISSLADLTRIQPEIFPLRYSRGVWNSLREGGFLPELEDPELSYYLFRMNELGFIANRNLRLLERAHLEGTGGDVGRLAEESRKNSQHLLGVLGIVLQRLEGIEAVALTEADFLPGEEVLDEEDSRG